MEVVSNSGGAVTNIRALIIVSPRACWVLDSWFLMSPKITKPPGMGKTEASHGLVERGEFTILSSISLVGQRAVPHYLLKTLQPK